MTYEAMDPRNFPLLWVYLGVGLVAWLMTALLVRKYFEKRKKPALLLSMAFVLVSLAITALFFGMLECYITGYKMEWYRFSLAFAYCIIMLALALQILFFADIYGIPMQLIKKYLLIALILAIALALPDNYYGVPDNEEVGLGPNIRPFTSIGMMLFSIAVFTRMGLKSFRTAKLVEEKIPRMGFQMIGLSEFCIVGLFFFMAMDTVVFTLFETGGYTIFVYIAWIFAGGFFISSYFGLIIPGRHAQKTESSGQT